jgi:hypothetical protein
MDITDADGRLRFDGRRVRAHRVAAGLTATALHARIRAAGHKLSLPGLTRIERGGGTLPTTALAIATALDKPLTDFVPLPAPRGRRHASATGGHR